MYFWGLKYCTAVWVHSPRRRLGYRCWYAHKTIRQLSIAESIVAEVHIILIYYLTISTPNCLTLANVFFWVEMLLSGVGAFLRKEARILVLACLAPISQTV
jgi:hypothetical protein